MGRTPAHYNDVASLDPEILRAKFKEADLCIAERPKLTIDLLRDMNALIKKYGPNLFTKTAREITEIHPDDSFSAPHRMMATSIEKEELRLLRSLADTVRAGVLHDLGNSQQFRAPPVHIDASVQSPPGYHSLC
jgi:hypothetical protein